MLGLGEVGEVAPEFPGFVRYGRASVAQAGSQGGVKGKGLYWYVRSSLSTYVKKIREDKFAVWLKLELPKGNTWYMAAIYLPPQGSVQWPSAQHRTDAFSGLQEQIVEYEELGHVYVVGDFNAHCGDQAGVIQADAEDILDATSEVGGVCWQQYARRQGMEIPSRSTLDTKPVDRGGRLLMKLCTESGCVLLNGRTPGDEAGALTHFKLSRTGEVLSQSVLDYGLCTRAAFPLVQHFRVLDWDPVLSDHCVLRTIVLVGGQDEGQEEQELTPSFPRWVADKRVEYTRALQAEATWRKLHAIGQGVTDKSLDVLQACQQLGQVVHEVASTVFGICGQQRRTQCGHLPKRWYKHVRREHAALKQAVRRGDTHAAAALRKVFNRAKRKWQAFYTRQYHANLIDDLKHNARRFWTKYKGSKLDVKLQSFQRMDGHWQQLYGQQGQGLQDIYGEERRMLEHLAHVANEKAGGQPFTAADQLNEPLQPEEVSAALHKAFLGRAAGPDGIRMEFFKGAYEVEATERGRVKKRYILLPVLHAVLNAVFESGVYPPEWSAATLSAVFKKGDPDDLNNYRGIAVGPALGKLFSMVLNSRLDVHAEMYGWRADGQAGFRKDRRTTDHVFVLRHLVDRIRFSSIKKLRLYACFVDLWKAYDSVLRALLLERLAAVGVHGNLMQALGNMYWEVSLQTKMHQKLGKPFLSTTGVKQGDPLSPLLFGIFIDEFEEWLASRLPEVGVECSNQLIRLLLYADDMVLLSSDPEGLQKQLDLLSEFCASKGLKVNLEKTEIVVYGKKGQRRQSTPTWTYQGEPVKVSDSFRYLGVCLHGTRGLTVATEALKSAGLRAMWGMLGKFKSMQLQDLYMKTHMFDLLVRPVLGYCCEVWGPDSLQGVDSPTGMLANSLQGVQSLFMRKLGGFRKSVNRQVMLKELCWSPLSAQWSKLIVNYWNRLATMQNGLLRRVFLDSVQMGCCNNVGWAAMVLGMLKKLGLTEMAEAIKHEAQQAVAAGREMEVPEVDEVKVMEAWEKVWESNWRQASQTPPAQCTQEVSLATHSFWMAPVERVIDPEAPEYDKWLKPGMPEYVRFTHRVAPGHLQDFMRFRCGSHKLAVVTGRWVQSDRTQRICQKCTRNQVEDEMHLVFHCNAYHAIRLQAQERCGLFNCVGGVEKAKRAGDMGLKLFMNQTPRQVARLISECMQHRECAPDLVRHFDGPQIDLFSSDDEHCA